MRQTAISFLCFQLILFFGACSTVQHRAPAAAFEGVEEDKELDFSKVIKADAEPNTNFDAVQSQLVNFADAPDVARSELSTIGLQVNLIGEQGPFSVLKIANTLIRSQNYLNRLNKVKIYYAEPVRQIDAVTYSNSIFASAIGFVAVKVNDPKSIQAQGIGNLILTGGKIARGEISGAKANAAIARMKNILALLLSKDALTSEEAFDQTAGVNDVVSIERAMIGFWEKGPAEIDITKKARIQPKNRVAFEQSLALQSLYFDVPVEQDGAIQVNSVLSAVGTTRKWRLLSPTQYAPLNKPIRMYKGGRDGEISLTYVDESVDGSAKTVEFESPIYRFRQLGKNAIYRYFTVEATVEQEQVSGVWQTTGAHFDINWMLDEHRPPPARRRMSQDRK
jgi:hypothetical protein